MAILARRHAVKDNKLHKDIFDDFVRLPTFTQFFPNLFFFEEVDRTLICSAPAGLPLVRYNLKDTGGVYTYEKVMELFSRHTIDLNKELVDRNLAHTRWNLPFVYVYERNDFSVSFYAFQIYPATIRRALEHPSLRSKITGKFSMQVGYDRNQNQRLEINLELKKGVERDETLKAKVMRLVVEHLLKESSEYQETYREKPRRALPHIFFWPYEHERFFRPGIKQKWIIRRP